MFLSLLNRDAFVIAVKTWNMAYVIFVWNILEVEISARDYGTIQYSKNMKRLFEKENIALCYMNQEKHKHLHRSPTISHN